SRTHGAVDSGFPAGSGAALADKNVDRRQPAGGEFRHARGSRPGHDRCYGTGDCALRGQPLPAHAVIRAGAVCPARGSVWTPAAAVTKILWARWEEHT